MSQPNANLPKRVRGRRMTLMVDPRLTLADLIKALEPAHMTITVDRKGQMVVTPIPPLFRNQGEPK